MNDQVLKWRDVESDVYRYVTSEGVKLTLDQFRNPRGGVSGRKYIGPSSRKFWKLDPPWVPSKTDDPMDYDDTLWRGVRAWEYFCNLIRWRCDDGKSCEEICDERLARSC
ncbi:hypothetical protein [Hyphomicrobium sp. CS1GBMeth3]|uniref:hypothetical protein n=1 Tax=Hyphomicrobium sp. CS1GBMeth3 TaxID=1892845 RepID=UPI001114E8DF|nr:hypothetical protein [Hyphomicrobium sp. CS1GBMeth3]